MLVMCAMCVRNTLFCISLVLREAGSTAARLLLHKLQYTHKVCFVLHTFLQNGGIVIVFV